MSNATQLIVETCQHDAQASLKFDIVVVKLLLCVKCCSSEYANVKKHKCHCKGQPRHVLLFLLPLIKQDFVEPIYFYIGAVFGLQAVCVTALFVCSWVMSGTWVAGVLAVSWYVINR